jgi:hypothetical protein
VVVDDDMMNTERKSLTYVISESPTQASRPPHQLCAPLQAYNSATF